MMAEKVDLICSLKKFRKSALLAQSVSTRGDEIFLLIRKPKTYGL
jgi:hypothetical protein